MATQIQIANRALQRIGARRVASLSEASREAQAVNACFDQIVEQELNTNFWTFAIRRVQLTANATAPDFGRATAYDLPTDYIRRAPDDPVYSGCRRDWLFEGRQLLTNDTGELDLRYVTRDVEPEDFHPMFANAVAMRIAAEICEELTQSSSKLDRVEGAYTHFIREARRQNAIEAGPINHEIDELVAVRITHGNDPTLRPYA